MRFIYGVLILFLQRESKMDLMKKTMFVKIPKESDIRGNFAVPKTLIRVCAWCPKNEYPPLKDSEDYTHGLCEKHYKMLKNRQKTLMNR